MKLRLAERGPNAGNYFWGCSGFPGCKHIVNLAEGEEPPEEAVQAIQRRNGNGSRPSSAWSVMSDLGMIADPHGSEVSQHPKTIRFRAHRVSSRFSVFDGRGVIRSELSRALHRNWGLEYSTAGKAIPEAQRALSSLLLKHLQRGQEVLIHPETEEYILRNESQLSAALRRSDFCAFNSDAFEFDSEEERQFWKQWAQSVPGVTRWLVPQAYLGTLIEGQADSNQRVDFLFCSADELKVIELDGAQHQELRQAEVDRDRDAILRANRIEVLRIPATGAGGRHLPRIRVSLHDVMTPAHFAHVVAIATANALKTGALTLGADGWRFAIVLPDPDPVLQAFCAQVVAGFMNHVSRAATLLGIQDQIPKEISFIRQDGAVAHIGRGETSSGEHELLTVHFDTIPAVDLTTGHYYYRELPTRFVTSVDVTDIPLKALQPTEECCRYFLNLFFRYAEFREGQWEGIRRTLEGLDSLVLMPTGHGKSIIYQLASLLRPGIALVIDPIISLMDDQIDNLARVGITRAVGISSQIESEEDKRRYIQDFGQGQYFFAFVAPERLQMSEFRNSLRSLTTFCPVNVAVIDEAHCVSEWGHDFRTSYLNLGRNVREYCARNGKAPPLLGLTGTASRSVLKDVKRELQILDFDAVITPETFDRPELEFRVQTCDSSEKAYRLTGILQSLPSNFGLSQQDFYQPSGKQTHSGLIFCPHVNGSYGVVETAHIIKRNLGIPVNFYSGSAPKSIARDTWGRTKRKAASDFKDDRVPLMVATSAFGMGIDKPNIRYCVHLGIPSSIESFYQEAGRAGRDRAPSICFVIASNDNPARTAEVLSDTNSIIKVEKVVKETSYGDSDDIIRALYFHTSSFRGVEAELENIDKALSQLDLSARTLKQSVDAKVDLSRVEKAIHRLVIIGAIRDYTVDYSAKRIDVVMASASAEDLRQSLLSYVQNYQRSRAKALFGKLPKGDVVTKDLIRSLVSILLEFIYQTVELGRRRALLEMSQVCSQNATDASIRERVLAYLEKSEFDDQLDEIVEDIETQDLIPRLMEDVASKQHAQTLRGQIIRFLESYPDHPSLLLMRAVVECMCPNSDASLVTASLENWASSAAQTYNLPLGSLAESYSYAMEIISKALPDAAAEASRTILRSCGDLGFIRHVLSTAMTNWEKAIALTVLLERSAEHLEQAIQPISEKAR